MGSVTAQYPPPGSPEPQRIAVGADTGDTSLSDAVATLRKRFWVVVVAGLLGLAYGTYKALTQPKLFAATSTVQVHNGSSNAYRLESSFYSDDDTTRMNTEVAILQSDTLLLVVAQDMNLANNPEFFGVAGPLPKASLSEPGVRARVLARLRTGLTVALVPRTQLMRITYSSFNPKLSADIVNQLVSGYVQRSFQTPAKQTRMVSEWLSGQLETLRHQVEHSQQEMMNLQRQLGVLGYDKANNNNEVQASLEGLLTAEGTAKIQRIDAESRYNMVKNMDPNTVQSAIETTPGTSSVELNALRAQLAADHAQYANLTADSPGGLGRNNPTVKALKTRIDELNQELTAEQNRIVTQARENYRAALGAEQSTHRELEARKQEAYNQGDDKVRLTIVQREFEQNRALYDGLQQRLETAKLEAGLDALEVDTVDEAVPAASPSVRSNSYVIGVTTLVFLVGGVIIAFLIEALDTRVHGVHEIESLLQLPSLALIPRARRGTETGPGTSAASRNVSVIAQPKSQFAESFRSLQTSLMLSSAGHPPKRIMLTSATPSEGKTTTATNLAAVLAQGDARVLLIDADLRRPSVHHRFGLPGKLGLSTLLAGTSTVAECLQTVPELPNLDVLPSGPVPPFPTEMLGSDTMRPLLEQFAATYDYVVIDSPPVLSVTDAVILGRMVDAVVLVIRDGKADRNVMRRTHDLLARSGAPLAGMVLNAVDLNSHEYGYYGYTGYSYGSMDAASWDTQDSTAPRAGGDDRS